MQLWTLILTAIAIIVAIVISLRQRRRRRIAYHERITALLSVDQQVQEHIKVSYRDVAVSALSLVELSFEHVGNEPIKPTDYESPVRITFGPTARVLTTEIIEM